MKVSLIVMKGMRVEDIYVLQEETVSEESVVSINSSVLNSTRLWYLHLGHIDKESLDVLKKRGLIDDACQSKPSSYGDCSFDKKKHVTFDVGSQEMKSENVHPYVCGLTTIASLGGTSYLVLSVDDFSLKIWIHFLKIKNEIFTKFKSERP